MFNISQSQESLYVHNQFTIVNLLFAEMNTSVVLHVILVNFFIKSNRQKLLETITVVQIMTFLSDNINGAQSVEKFSSLNSFVDKLSLHVTDKIVLQSFKDSVHDYFFSLDSFLNLNSAIQEVFEYDTSESINELYGPIKVCHDSFLGVFVRSFIAQWECISFETGCVFYEEFLCFISPKTLTTTDDIATVGFYSHSSDHLTVAVESIARGDLAVTEEAIHRHFDIVGSAEGHKDSNCNQGNITAISDTPSGGASVVDALSNLLCSIGGIGNAVDYGSAFNSKVTATQQRAMLSLVTMWTANLATGGESGEVALSAVEEAMRTAHKRGDHDAVARTLLLMYHVLQQKNLSHGDLSVGLEDLLLRCVQRFAALKHHIMVSEAALSLVALRAKGPLLWSDPPRQHGSDGKGDVSVGTAKWSVADLWTQINAALLGNSALINRVTKTPSNRNKDGKVGIAATAPSAAPHLANRGQNKELQSDAYLLDGAVEDQARLHVMAAIVSCDLWRRMGMLYMAEMACKRTLRQYTATASRADLSALYAKLLMVKVDATNLRLISKGPKNSESLFLFEGDELAANFKCQYDVLVTWAKSVHKVLRADSWGAATLSPDLLEAALLYARVFQSVGRGKWNQALRLAERSVELSGPISARGMAQCEEHLRARILLAKVMFRTNFPAAHQILLEVEANARRSDMLQVQCVSSAVLHIHALRRGDLVGRVEAAAKLKTTLTFAHQMNVAEPEIAIASGLMLFSDGLKE
jgi:hypothetical protein